MALYMYQGAYTAESVAAQIREPRDRVEAVRPALEAMGGTIVPPVTHSADTERSSCWRYRMTPRQPASGWP